MSLFILALGAESYKFVCLKPRVYWVLEASCWPPYWIHHWHRPFIQHSNRRTFYWQFSIWNTISQALKGKRGKENSFEHGFDRIRVFTWRPSLISERLMNKNGFLSCCSRKQSCGKSKKCSKPNAHPGRCDSKRVFHEFWKSSTSHIALKRKGQLNEENRKIEEELHTKKARLDEVGKYYRVF